VTHTVTIVADGQTVNLTTAAATVNDALAEAGIVLNPADEVTPPSDILLPLPAGASTITVVRVTETMETIPETVPFERRIVRTADMSPDDPPRIVQTGASGLREVSVRIVYHDGLEVERWPTGVTIIEPPVHEIVMIGVGSDANAMPLAGRLAYIDDGRAIVLEGATDAPRQIAVDGVLDGRVFQLSPDGEYLLYTVAQADSPGTFRNELQLIATTAGAEPQPLAIENVLWAGWDPAATPPRIAYTTARSTTQPPGWEANNDLWLLAAPAAGAQAAPVRLVETYPATFGWWGGDYAWSPDGRRLAYALADEIGWLDMPAAGEGPDFATPTEPPRTVLQNFTAYDTGGEWVWLPSLSWSADGRWLAFTEYDAENDRFDLRRVDVASNAVETFSKNVGIWSAAAWSPAGNGSLAALQSVDAGADEDSAYALWLLDESGGRQRLFPPEGEAGDFARAALSLAWGPGGDALAFIFDDALHFLDLTSGDVFRAGLDDTTSSRPSWSPYGSANIAPATP
jgi:Tol biopolymer transport system component